MKLLHGRDGDGLDAICLWWACCKGLDAVALRLLDLGGVVVNAKPSTNGATPLLWTCAKGLGAVALRLLDLGGVDVDAKDSTNGTNVLVLGVQRASTNL